MVDRSRGLGSHSRRRRGGGFALLNHGDGGGSASVTAAEGRTPWPQLRRQQRPRPQARSRRTVEESASIKATGGLGGLAVDHGDGGLGLARAASVTATAVTDVLFLLYDVMIL